ncbi:hypothetical protein EMCG_00471 [[Emmonsia] crescens]|uniref:Uncharacterized protein n=1 Tax=[Emmonsia] crescens TaxID=73230 RepID=A0A0G2J8F8_9EURO|nr:hypothetical protein EMCG_00471 [Emmonsia crescens UAMH 3008]
MRAFTFFFAIPVVYTASLKMRNEGSVSTSVEPFCPQGKWAEECQLQQSPSSTLTERSAEVAARAGESGSWCYKPASEAFWGAASAGCCDLVNGSMRGDRRCYGLKGSGDRCNKFYECCKNKYRSRNRPGKDKCY